MNRHTPGLWQARKFGLYWRVEAPNLESDAGPEDTFVLIDYNLSEADARLIAQAPTMLHLLKQSLAFIERPREFAVVQENLAKIIKTTLKEAGGN